MFRVSLRGPFTLCTIDKDTMGSREPRSGLFMTAVGQFLLGLEYIYIDTLINIMKAIQRLSIYRPMQVDTEYISGPITYRLNCI